MDRRGIYCKDPDAELETWFRCGDWTWFKKEDYVCISPKIANPDEPEEIAKQCYDYKKKEWFSWYTKTCATGQEYYRRFEEFEAYNKKHNIQPP